MDSLICSNILVEYPQFSLELNINIPQGMLVSIIGPSGCGKSTTLQLISGLLPITTGTVILGGKDITVTPVNERNIALVFQDYALFPHMNVEENIGYSLKLRHVKKKERIKKVNYYLELVELEGYGLRKIEELSGGERQRVAFARALASDPELLLLDEPLSALDAKKRKYLREQIRSIHDATGITTIYVTHDQEEALSLSDQIIVMNNGKIEQIGTPEDIYYHPKNLFVADFMGEGSLLETRVIHNQHLEINGSFFTEEQSNSSAFFIRPEVISIIEDHLFSIPSLIPHIIFKEASIVSRSFIGGRYLITLDWQGQRIVTYSNNSPKSERVNLVTPLSQIHFFYNNVQ